MTWCWYIEGGAFFGGFASRSDAVRAAHMDEADRERVYVGIETDPIEEMARVVDAHAIAEQLEEHLNVEDCYVHIDPGAHEALREWVRNHLSFDAHSVCLNGEQPTAEEWEEVSR